MIRLLEQEAGLLSGQLEGIDEGDPKRFTTKIWRDLIPVPLCSIEYSLRHCGPDSDD